MRLSFQFNGFKCPPNMTGHLQKVFDGEYDVPIEGPQKILDLGANCGAFALWAFHRWPGSAIQCYEPHPETFKILEENLAGYPRISAHEKAVGLPGFRPLFNGPNNCGEASLQQMMNNPAPTGQHVEVIDPIRLPKADILKMDIEGSEVEVLGPLVKDGRKFRAVLLEYHHDVLRRIVDGLLPDYVLWRIESVNCMRGTACYVHQDELK